MRSFTPIQSGIPLLLRFGWIICIWGSEGNFPWEAASYPGHCAPNSIPVIYHGPIPVQCGCHKHVTHMPWAVCGRDWPLPSLYLHSPARTWTLVKGVIKRQPFPTGPNHCFSLESINPLDFEAISSDLRCMHLDSNVDMLMAWLPASRYWSSLFQ